MALFLIVLGDVLREARKLHQASGIIWTMISFLRHLDYADGICLFAYKIQELSAWLSLLKLWRLLVALQLTAFGILSPVRRNANLSTPLKLRLFKSNVTSVLLYGCCI